MCDQADLKWFQPRFARVDVPHHPPEVSQVLAVERDDTRRGQAEQAGPGDEHRFTWRPAPVSPSFDRVIGSAHAVAGPVR